MHDSLVSTFLRSLAILRFHHHITYTKDWVYTIQRPRLCNKQRPVKKKNKRRNRKKMRKKKTESENCNPREIGKIRSKERNCIENWTMTKTRISARKQTRREEEQPQKKAEASLLKISVLAKTGIEFHWPRYQFIAPGNKSLRV